jgi:hypothetical protein
VDTSFGVVLPLTKANKTMLDAEAVKERLRNYGGKIIVTNQATGTFIGRQSASPITNGTD